MEDSNILEIHTEESLSEEVESKRKDEDEKMSDEESVEEEKNDDQVIVGPYDYSQTLPDATGR